MRQSIRPGRTRKPRALDVEREDWGLYGPIPYSPIHFIELATAQDRCKFVPNPPPATNSIKDSAPQMGDPFL